MGDVEYLSIAEFAEKAGISKQAIYKQVHKENSQIAPYVLRDGKRNLIRASALSELYGVDTTNLTFTTTMDGIGTENSTPIEKIEVEKSTQQTTKDNHVEQPIQPNSTPENQPISTDYIGFLKTQIAELKAEKAEMESRLNSTIQEKDAIIKDQTAQLAQLAQQVAQIADKAIIATSQQQYLTAMEKGKRTDATPIEVRPMNPKNVEQSKRGFFRRFFK